MQRVTSTFGKVATLVVVASALVGCSKKDNYGADTAAAQIDTTSQSTYSARSTAPAMQDTATTAAATTKSAGTKSTTKKSTTTAPKKTSY